MTEDKNKEQKGGLRFEQWLAPEKRRRLIPLLAALIIGLALMFFSQGKEDTNEVSQIAAEQPSVTEKQSSELSGAEAEAARMEARLEESLSQIKGAGKVSVTVTYKTGSRMEYAVDASTKVYSTEEQSADGSRKITTETTTNDTVVQSQDGSSPVWVQEEAGEVQGVLIVAEGGDDSLVAAQLTNAVAALLDLPAHKITVCPAATQTSTVQSTPN